MGLFGNKDTKDLKRMAEQRRVTEDEEPWFLAEDDEPELRVETGIGSNLDRDPDRRRDR